MKNKKDMLHPENKIFSLLFFVIFIASCNKYKEYSIKETEAIRKRCIENSQANFGYNEYWKVYNNINDSINNWKDNNFGLYKYFSKGKGLNHRVDSVLCFNENKDKFITTIFSQCIDDCVSDEIWHFYGVRIKGRWYFFEGPTLVLPREYYQEDIHTPLSFEKLKQIATAHIYSGYLKKGIGRQRKINDAFFRDITSGAWCTDCVTQEDWDKKYLSIIREKWTKRDTTDNE
jgi:hypothetical protein